MNDDPQLLKDARRHGIVLAAQRPETVSLCRLHIRWTGWRWALKTFVGTPVAFASRPQDLRDRIPAFCHFCQAVKEVNCVAWSILA